MYAHRRVYVKQWEHQKPEERFTVRIERGGKPVAGIKPERISGVEEEVMYWRKANHIHAWFVDRVQKGVDNCAEYYVGMDGLRDLLSRCQKVIEASNLVEGTNLVGETLNPDTNAWEERREPGMVIEDPTLAAEILPTKPGFFFGSTEYGEDYLNEVIRTRDWAKSMIEDYENGVPGDIYYSSSW